MGSPQALANLANHNVARFEFVQVELDLGWVTSLKNCLAPSTPAIQVMRGMPTTSKASTGEPSILKTAALQITDLPCNLRSIEARRHFPGRSSKTAVP